jgi:hypothetical protein
LRLKIPEFRIPDFQLGALMATVLLSVGALLAFPDIPYGFVWEILAVVSIIVWALGARLVVHPFWPCPSGINK